MIAADPSPVFEEWRPVRGFVGRYQVSSRGRMKGARGDLLSLSPNGRGYLTVSLLDHAGKRHTLPLHRIVLEAFVGPRPDGLQCCHTNGDRLDNAASNLRWDTAKSNSHDKKVHQTDRLSVSLETLREIHRRFDAGEGAAAIARSMGLNRFYCWRWATQPQYRERVRVLLVEPEAATALPDSIPSDPPLPGAILASFAATLATLARYGALCALLNHADLSELS